MSNDPLKAHQAICRRKAKELFERVGKLESGDLLELATLLTGLRVLIWEAGLGEQLRQLEAETCGRYYTPAWFAVIHLSQTAELSVEELAECLATECTRLVKPEIGWPDKETNEPLERELDVDYLKELQVHWLRMGRDLLNLELDEPYLGIAIGDREASRTWDGKEYVNVEFGKKEKPWELFGLLVNAGAKGIHRRELLELITASLDKHKRTLSDMIEPLELDIHLDRGMWTLIHLGQ